MVAAMLLAYQRHCRWMSIPRQVSRLKAQEGVDRTRAVKTLEALCGEFGSRRSFRRWVLQSGGLEPLVTVLNHGSARAACASLYVLRSLVAEEGVTRRLGEEAHRRVLDLAASDNLRLRSRATWFVSHFATTPETITIFAAAVADKAGAFQTLVMLLESPLPEDFQFVLEQPPGNISRTILKVLRDIRAQIRWSMCLAIASLSNSCALTEAFISAGCSSLLVPLVRDPAKDLQQAASLCLKAFMQNASGRDAICKSIPHHWKEITPSRRDFVVLQLLSELLVHEEFRQVAVDELFILHRIPALLASDNQAIRVTSLALMCQLAQNNLGREKILESGLVQLLADSLHSRNVEVQIGAVLCLSNLCLTQPGHVAVRMELACQRSMPSHLGEYLVLMVMVYPKQGVSRGALKVLAEVAPKLRSALPRHVIAKLRDEISSDEPMAQASSAQIINEMVKVKRFRSQLMKAGVMEVLLGIVKARSTEAEAPATAALASLAQDGACAEQLAKQNDLTELLFLAQGSAKDDIAIAALELLRVLSQQPEFRVPDLEITLPGCDA